MNERHQSPRFLSHQTVPLVCLWYYCCSMTTLPFFQRILHQKHNIMARYTLEQQQCCQQATALPQRGRPSIQQQTNLGKKLTFFSDSASVFRVVPPCHSMMILLTFIGSQAEKEEMNSIFLEAVIWKHQIQKNNCIYHSTVVIMLKVFAENSPVTSQCVMLIKVGHLKGKYSLM